MIGLVGYNLVFTCKMNQHENGCVSINLTYKHAGDSYKIKNILKTSEGGIGMDQQWKENLVKTYDRYALERDQSEIEQWKAEARDHFLELLKKEGKTSLLEIGAGTGRDGKFFKEKGMKVVCIDLSPEMVRLCQEKELRAYVMDFYKLEFLPGTFDAVWALNCLLHVPKADMPDVLKEIEKVLRPKGLFYLGIYGGQDSEGVWADDHYQPQRFFSFYTDEQITAVVQEHFELLSFKTIPVSEKLTFQSMILQKR